MLGECLASPAVWDVALKKAFLTHTTKSTEAETERREENGIEEHKNIKKD